MRKAFLSVFISALLVFCMVLPAFAADPVPVEGITLEPDSAVVSVGKTLSVKAVITPKNATAKKPEWSSSDETVATVQNGKVKGIAPGTATITAKAADDSGVSASLEVSVVQPVKKISVEDPKLTLPPGTVWEQIAYIEPQDASMKELIWTSSDERIAAVDSQGVITTVAVGKCTVTGTAADDSKKKVSVPVQVQEYDLLILSPGTQTVDFSLDETEGFAMGVTARGAYQDAYRIAVQFETGCVTKAGEYAISPVRAGSDTITITETHNGINTRKDIYTVFVSQAAVRGEGAVPEMEPGGEILFRDIPWGSSYNEVRDLLASRGESLHGMTVRNKMLWTKIDGELTFGNFKAYNNGLSFASDILDKARIEESKDTCSLCMADYYFDPEIPFENLKQNVMKTYGLPKNDTTDSDSECSWTVGDVTVTLFVKPKYTQLKIDHSAPAAEAEEI